MKTLTTEQAKEILTRELGISEDTLKLHEIKGYKKSIKFIKEWSHKLDFLTFNTSKDGSEMFVNIRACAL